MAVKKKVTASIPVSTPAPLMTEEQWLELPDKGLDPADTFGVELTVRMIIGDPADHEYLQEVLDLARQYGSCVVSKRVMLKPNK